MREWLEHTADLGLRATAPSLEDLYSEAALALIETVLDPSAVRASHTFPIHAVGADLEELLVNFLNEVLYLLDGARIGLCRVVVLQVSPDNRIEAVGLGEPRQDARHPPRLVVKAVTYHQLRLEKQPEGGWLAELFLDI